MVDHAFALDLVEHDAAVILVGFVADGDQAQLGGCV